jgi:hypothetical protein
MIPRREDARVLTAQRIFDLLRLSRHLPRLDDVTLFVPQDVEWIHRPFWLLDLLAKIDSQTFRTQQVASQTALTKAT